MEDVQSLSDSRKIPISQVGIKDIKHPIAVNDKSGKVQHTIATFNMYVSLPDNFKGTHMSRFVEILNQYEYEITVKSFHKMLGEVVNRLEAKIAYIAMEFPFFVEKIAPATKIKSLMDYQVSFIGVMDNGNLDFRTKVTVAATSLCPCSKKISAYGAHNQRSHITVEVKANDFIWLEDLITLIENQASAEVYSLLKRPDEKIVTEQAYDNPKFVEDLVRDVAHQLNQDARIQSYTVEAENFESIHNHSAYAKVMSD